MGFSQANPLDVPEGTTPPRGPVLIFAGTQQEASFYAEKFGLAPREWVYVTPHMTRGRMNPTVYLVGTYHWRSDFYEMRDALAPCRPRYIDEDGHEVTRL